LRIFQICRELSRHHELTLLSLCETKREFYSWLPQDGVFRRIERVWLPKWRSLLNVFAALPTRIPLQVAYYQSNAFRKKIDKLLPFHDLCLAHLIRTGEYVRYASVPKILEMTDAISMSYQRMREVNVQWSLKSWAYRIEADRLSRYERMAIRDFQITSLVSNVDRKFLLKDQECQHVIVCSNGVDCNILPFHNRDNSKPVVIFIGNMISLSNLDACMYFAKNVLPLVRKEIECVFRVVGRIKPKDASILEAIDGVEVVPNVQNIAEAAADARVGLAPIRFGAGIQNKVLEYMALGLPVVSSPIALEGLDAKVEQHLLIAVTPEEYVKHLCRLWSDSFLRNQLALAAHAYVLSNHSWSKCLLPLIEKIDEML